MDEYVTIRTRSEGVFKDRKSRFVAFAFPISSEAEAKNILVEIKKEYHDASQYCYAYRCLLSNQEMIEHFDDDDEPSHSAGIQILYVIRNYSLLNVMVIVLRYYGGIKLGIPGLIHAYKTATNECLSSSKKESVTITKHFRVVFTYDVISNVMSIIKKNHSQVLRQLLDINCEVEIKTPIREADSLLHAFAMVSPKIQIYEIN